MPHLRTRWNSTLTDPAMDPAERFLSYRRTARGSLALLADLRRILRIPGRFRRRPSPPLLMALALLALPACASNSTRTETPTAEGQAVALVDEVLFAFPGRTFVAPIGVRGGQPAMPDVRLVSGDPLPTELVWYRGQGEPLQQWQPAEHHWVQPGLLWSANAQRPPSPGPDEAGFWALLIQMPQQTQDASVTIDGLLAPIRWLDQPDDGAPPAIERRSPIEVLPPDLIERLRPLVLDPTRRWRVELLADRLGFDMALLRELLIVPLEEERLDILSRQLTDQWRAGMRRLRALDAQLADQCLRALTLLVRTQEGVLLPAWRPSDPLRRQFLAAMLDPARSDYERIGWAQSWLESQPVMVSWTHDDAGAAAFGSEAVVQLSVANLMERDEVAWLRRADDRRSPRVRIPAGATANVIARPTPGRFSERMELRLGALSEPADFLPGAIPLRPPGLAIGPFLQSWRLDSWLGRQPEPPANELTCAALLHWSPEGDTLRAFLEIKGRSDLTGAFPRDEVTLWLGPTSGLIRPLVVRSDGALFRGAIRRSPVGVIDVSLEEDRWTALVDIPAEAINADGELLLGITRSDARGRRSSWPRPLMPGQVEPGRARIDCAAWARSGALDSEVD